MGMGRICYSKFQSTPPRRGRHAIGQHISSVALVSIHAPAQGATMVCSCTSSEGSTFQSTPPRRGRPDVAEDTEYIVICFNPRPRAGGDISRLRSLKRLTVSIHAPAQGATTCSSAPIGHHLFQSTPPRRGRRTERKYRRGVHRFNPRPRAGGDITHQLPLSLYF